MRSHVSVINCLLVSPYLQLGLWADVAGYKDYRRCSTALKKDDFSRVSRLLGKENAHTVVAQINCPLATCALQTMFNVYVVVYLRGAIFPGFPSFPD